ncbi:MAG TPA: hypothetical protein VNJ03_07625 [Vicinamibacterales bacterium]|nr:hypothetical protein [Vicinamibacterales bacterium]
MTAGHLDDAALAAVWTASAGAATINDPHLLQCAECRVRLAAFVGWMDDVRTNAIAEADEAFPAERLAAQHAQILRRLEAAERPARVIAFPSVQGTDSAQPASSIRRWIAAAAAAGLIAGVGIGQMMNLGQLRRPSSFVSDRTAASQPRAVPAAGAVVPASMVSEEALLAELEAAATPRYDALRAYDQFTPHAADYIRPRTR